MANYNKVILVGNLTRDPQLSYLPSQTPVVEIGLAINRRWRGQDAQQREETCFVDCRAYGKQAETMNQYLSKGRPVLIEGRLQLDTWQAQDGTRRSKHRVIVERFQFMGARGAGQGAAAEPAPAQGAPAEVPPAPEDIPSGPPPTEYEGPGDPGGDNIPF